MMAKQCPLVLKEKKPKNQKPTSHWIVLIKSPYECDQLLMAFRSELELHSHLTYCQKRMRFKANENCHI